jgi:hypothetical protein
VSSKSDTLLFFLNNKQVMMFVLVYVDDIIIASSSQEATSRLLKNLEEDFALKDLRDLHYFLGIEVTDEGQGWYSVDSAQVCDRVTPTGRYDWLQAYLDTVVYIKKRLSADTRDPLGLIDATNY